MHAAWPSRGGREEEGEGEVLSLAEKIVRLVIGKNVCYLNISSGVGCCKCCGGGCTGVQAGKAVSLRVGSLTQYSGACSYVVAVVHNKQ